MADIPLKTLKLHGIDHTYIIPTKPDDIGAAPEYTYGTEELVEGVSELETGKLYFVYE